MNSQDSRVSSSEETHSKRESPAGMLDKSAAQSVDSSGIDSVSSPPKDGCREEPESKDGKLAKTFPWITEFSKLCQAEIGLTQIHSLENLMNEYIKHVSFAASDCHFKPNRAAKLKKTMNRTLLLFHLFYTDIKKPLEHSFYLDKMSDLMAIYLDMEITASSRSKESLYKIASKLTSSLFIFLDRSHDHILDSIFKAKYINKNYWELCNLLFIRVLRESPGRAVCDMTYVRYVLAFKMWKRLVKTVEEKRDVMDKATMRLHPPPHFRESVKDGILSEILPKIPKAKDDITMFYMQAKFCVKEKTKAFLRQFSTSEKRGSINTYMVNLNRIPLSHHNDKDESRLTCDVDQEDHCNRPGALRSNIWANRSDDSDIMHNIRVPNMSKAKKQVKCVKAKCKGIATPVFKTTPQTCDNVENLKKRRRLQDRNEEAGLDLLSKCGISSSNVTVVRPRMEKESVPQVQVSNVESCQSSPTLTVKKEPESNPDVTDGKHESVMRADDNQAPGIREEQQNQVAQSLIDQTVERLKESGRRYNEGRIEVQKPLISEKCLHDRTLRMDFNVFTSQQEIRSSILNNSMTPEMSVPKPSERLSDSSVRCMCEQCCGNQMALKVNYNILTQFWESKQGNFRTSSVSTLETNQDQDPSSSLPFKKRRALLEKDEEERPSQPNSGMRDVQVSYPGTPMISIAMLDPKGQCLSSECSVPFTGVIDYSVASYTAGYENLPASFVPSSTNPAIVGAGEVSETVLESAAQPSYTPLPDSYNPPEINTKFKTPAQLKESPVQDCSNEIDVAQTLSTSATCVKRKKSNSHSKSSIAPSKVKSKTKTKVDKNLRKRKY